MKLHLPRDAASWFANEAIDVYLDFLRRPRALPVVEQRMATRLTDAFNEGKGLVCEDPSAPPLSTPQAYDVPVREALRAAIELDPEPALRWLLIAWDLMAGAHDFCRDELEVLVVDDVANVAWSVAAASWVRYWSGQETTVYLFESLQKLEARIARFRHRVKDLAQTSDDFVGPTSRAALLVLGGGRLPNDIR